jgi:hypothetical protein
LLNGTKRRFNVPPEIGVRVSLVSAREPLRALANITLGFQDAAITLRRCAVFEKAGQPPWVSLPRLPIARHGKKSFGALVELPHELRQRVFDAVLARYQQLCDED